MSLDLGSSLEKFHLLGYHTHHYLHCYSIPSAMCTFVCISPPGFMASFFFFEMFAELSEILHNNCLSSPSKYSE